MGRFFGLEFPSNSVFTRHLRLIDDSHHIQTGNGSSILGGLTLGIIEVGRNSDYSMCNLIKQVTLNQVVPFSLFFFHVYYLTFLYLLAQISLSSLLHLCQHHSRDLFGGKCLHLATNINLNMGLALFFSDLRKKINHHYPHHSKTYILQQRLEQSEILPWREST